MIFYLLIGFVTLCFLMVVWLAISIIKNSVSNKVHGKKVLCTIKDVKRVDRRDPDKVITESHLEANCEFEYNGVHHESLVEIYNEIDPDVLEKGSTLECIYNTKKDVLVPIMFLPKRKNFNDFWFKMTVISALLLVIYCLFFYSKHQDVLAFNIILYALTLILWYSACLLFYDWRYIKDKNQYIKLKGKVVDYHTYTITDDTPQWHYYAPELSFEYNGKKVRFVSSGYNTKKKYNIGQEVDVYYNPETQKVYEVGNNNYIKIMMCIPVLVIILFVLKAIFKF